MKIKFTDIRTLRANNLKDPVTLAYCDVPNGLGGIFAEELNEFNPPNENSISAVIDCYRQENQSTIEAFYAVDREMKYYVDPVYEVLLIQPIQEMIQDPYDEEEMTALYGIALGWAEQTGCKIILVLDTSNSFKYYPKEYY